MDKNAFMKLVNDNDGFEFVIGYRDDLDYYIGGVGNKYWFQWIKGKDSEYYIGTYENGVWTDKHYIAKNKKIIESNTVEPETTINKIVERAYYYQDRIGNIKPTEIDKEYDTFLHYVFVFYLLPKLFLQSQKHNEEMYHILYQSLLVLEKKLGK